MIKIYSTSWCGPCAAAKALLKTKGIAFEEIDIEAEGMSRNDLANLTGGGTVPQIVINGKCIGGYDSLIQLNQSGDLDRMTKDA